MLKKVAILDLIIGVIGAVLIQIFYGSYAVLFLLGLFMAAIGFSSSGLAVKWISKERSEALGGVVSLISFIKVLVISIIGVLIFNNNINNVIFYIMGFTSHFFALILYGIIYLLKERK